MRRIVLATLAVLLVAVLVPSAAMAIELSPDIWDAFSQYSDNPQPQASLARSADGRLNVAYSLNLYDAFAIDPSAMFTTETHVVRLFPDRPFTPYMTPAQKIIRTSGQMNWAPAIVANGNELYAFTALNNYGLANPLLAGLVYARSVSPTSASSWSAPHSTIVATSSVNVGSGASPISATRATNGSLVQTWRQDGNDVWVHSGIASLPATPAIRLSHVASGNFFTAPNVAARSNGQVMVAWYEPTLGVRAQLVNPSTGATASVVWTLPGTAAWMINQRVPLVANASGFYIAYPVLTGVPATRALRVWRLSGTSAPVLCATVASASTLDWPTIAVQSDGRVWTAWLEKIGSKYYVRARRSNPAVTMWGPFTARVPAWFEGLAPSDGSHAYLHGLAVNPTVTGDRYGRLDVVGSYQEVHKVGDAGTYTLCRTQLPAFAPTVTKSVTHVHVRTKSNVYIYVKDAGVGVKGARVQFGTKVLYTDSNGRTTKPFVVGPYTTTRTLTFKVTKGYSYAATSTTLKVVR